MRTLLLLCVAVVSLVSGQETNSTGIEIPALNYHDLVGIPLAKKIKDAEDEAIKNGRIVGGAVASVNQYPYLGGLIISMTHTTGNSVCGSSLISANRGVTAAHCWWDGNRWAWQFEVVFGAQFLFFSPGVRIITQQVVMHPQWIPSTLENDVAVIYFPTPVTISQSVQPVALPTGNLLWQDFTGWWGTAAGYGQTSQGVSVTIQTQVHHVNVRVISNAECTATYGSAFIRTSTICTSGAGGVGICPGDSGGPLVVVQNGQNVLVGISSFAANMGGLPACQMGFPSGFARVSSFVNWILTHMW